MSTKMVFAVRGEGTERLEIDVYDDIGESFWGEGVTAKAVLRAIKSAPDAKEIRLRVNSRGGSVFDGIAIYNLLSEHAARVIADVDALAASAASLILMAADEIRIAETAMIMIHNPWTWAAGESGDLRDTADLLDKIQGQLADAYAARTGLDRERVVEMMAAETWMTALEAKELGFATEVKPSKQAEESARALAGLDLSGFERAPVAFAMAVANARVRLAPPQRQHVMPRANAGAQSKTETPSEKSGEEKSNMDLEKLKSQHPDLYRAVVNEGVEKERKRVNAHLKLAKATGAMEVAFSAIASGASTMDEEIYAEYMAAGLNRADRTARQTETDQAGAVVDNANTEEPTQDLGDQVVAFLEGGV